MYIVISHTNNHMLKQFGMSKHTEHTGGNSGSTGRSVARVARCFSEPADILPSEVAGRAGAAEQLDENGTGPPLQISVVQACAHKHAWCRRCGGCFARKCCRCDGKAGPRKYVKRARADDDGAADERPPRVPASRYPPPKRLVGTFTSVKGNNGTRSLVCTREQNQRA